MAVTPYTGRRIALATMHRKEAVIAPPMRRVLGVELVVPAGLDTDALGTFSGEIPRQGTMGDVAVAKARMGMLAAGVGMGLASEGSYGPHPEIPVIAVGRELLVLVDDERGIVVFESLIDDAPRFAHVTASPGADITSFLAASGFPEHAMIVGPNEPATDGPFVKGIRDAPRLYEAISGAAGSSRDGLALVQTDMRAHMNPTRNAALGRLADRLAVRLTQRCPACGTPGFGIVDVEIGLPCRECGGPSVLMLGEIHGCACTECAHREHYPRPDRLEYATPADCPYCNP
ncbi:MAG: DUF6671 family protein [Chromatocurvus sp.]